FGVGYHRDLLSFPTRRSSDLYNARKWVYCPRFCVPAIRRHVAMSKPSYRALHVALRIFSVLLAIGALFMIFGTRGLVIRVFLHPDRKSTRLNSSHEWISYAVF